ADYKQIPVEERSYVYNYTKLADKMNELEDENESENLRKAMEHHTDGNGAITPIYTDRVAEDNGEITEDDLAKIEKIVVEDEKVKIDELQAEIDNLNETIVTEVFPIENIQVKDKKQVEKIMTRYESLSDYDKQQIINYEDVEKAEAQIVSMERKRYVMIAL